MQRKKFTLDLEIQGKNIICVLEKYKKKENTMVYKTKGVFGVGYKSKETNIKGCPAYVKWVNMLQRCYYRVKPAYSNTKVCEEWHEFEAFKIWFYGQDWEGKQLDKDILGDGSIYGPDTCCFVSRKVNNFLVGVSESSFGYTKNKGDKEVYVARVSNPFTGGREVLGEFGTKEEATVAWKVRKKELAIELSKEIDDKRVSKRVRESVG